MRKKTVIILFCFVLAITVGLWILSFAENQNAHADTVESAVLRLGYYLTVIMLVAEECFLLLSALYFLSNKKTRSRTAFYVALPLIVPVLFFISILL